MTELFFTAGLAKSDAILRTFDTTKVASVLPNQAKTSTLSQVRWFFIRRAHLSRCIIKNYLSLT